MAKDKNARKLRIVRHKRVRKKVVGGPARPRLCVFRSLRHIYAQIIDDANGHTLVSATSHETMRQVSLFTSGMGTMTSIIEMTLPVLFQCGLH